MHFNYLAAELLTSSIFNVSINEMHICVLAMHVCINVGIFYVFLNEYK